MVDRLAFCSFDKTEIWFVIVLCFNVLFIWILSTSWRRVNPSLPHQLAVYPITVTYAGVMIAFHFISTILATGVLVIVLGPTQSWLLLLSLTSLYTMIAFLEYVMSRPVLAAVVKGHNKLIAAVVKGYNKLMRGIGVKP